MLPEVRRSLPARSLVSKYQGTLAPMFWMALEPISFDTRQPPSMASKSSLPRATTLPATTSRTPPRGVSTLVPVARAPGVLFKSSMSDVPLVPTVFV